MRYSQKKLQRIRARSGYGAKGIQFSAGTPQQIYANFMSEITERLNVLNSAINNTVPLPVMITYELCYLQLRMICECIALSCLIAHGDISDVTIDDFLNNYEADDIIRKLVIFIMSSFQSQGYLRSPLLTKRSLPETWT